MSYNDGSSVSCYSNSLISLSSLTPLQYDSTIPLLMENRNTERDWNTKWETQARGQKESRVRVGTGKKKERERE